MEILKRSIVKNAAMESTSFSASAFLRTKGYATLSGSAVVQGVLRSAGGWSADISFQGRDSIGTGAFESGRIRSVSRDGTQILLSFDSLQGPIVENFIRTLTGSSNGWWSIGEPSMRTNGRGAISPMQLNDIASLFQIHALHPPEKLFGSVKSYRLDISLIPNAVRNLFGDFAKENATVSGTLWINAKDFTLLRAVWNLEAILTPLGPADLVIDVTLSGSTATPEIILPTGSAGILSFKSVFATISQ